MKLTLTLALVLCLGMQTSAAILRPVNLRCEYRTNPLGIGIDYPRLSWVLQSDQPAVRGQTQSAYQILVATSRDLLNQERGDLWDSKKVQSDETTQIVYAGKSLAPNQFAYWTVRTWNKSGEPSKWSEPAMWSFAIRGNDWKAKWIGYNAKTENESASAPEEQAIKLDGLKWIWTDEGDATKDVPEGDRFFARKISLPEGNAIRRALLLLSVDDTYQLQINGKAAGGGGNFKQATLVDITPFLKPGENMLAIQARNGKGPAGLIGRAMVWLDGANEPITLDIDKTWVFSRDKPAGWDDGKIDVTKLAAAKEAVPLGEGPWGKPEKRELTLPPPPYLRKPFAVVKSIKRATLYATARGVYEIHLNGQRVGVDELTPGWTNYNKRIYFQTYDVTQMIRQRDNVIAAILGDGWYSGYFSYQGKRSLYGADPSLLAQLEIEYDDGRKERIVTDESWKCAYGPIREADLLMGSAYDARKEIDGWDRSGFDDSSWQPAEIATAPTAAIEPHPGNLPRRHEEIHGQQITEPTPGVYVIDLGQNIVGWAALKVRGEKPGTRITMRFSEMLNPDGSPYLIALRGARALDTYFAKGADEETFDPKFTFHGFRYVEITGLSKKPEPQDVTGIVVHTQMPRTGQFECSNQLVNQLFHNIIWGQKGNYLEVPTDCPQRDERLGWTGDAQFFIRTGAYNFDVAAFFTKWLVDLDQDAQHADGTFADVAPDLLGGHGNVAWGDAGIICPYVIYRTYGDRRIIAQNYDAMKRYIEHLKKDNKNLIRGVGAYGDWLNLDDKTKPEVIGTAYFHYVVTLMAEMADAIDKREDHEAFTKLADEIKKAFVKNFVNEDGSIKESGQTGYALAFTMNLIPDDKRKLAADQFAKAIERKKWHLATGFIGTPRLLPALTAANRSDIAYRLLLTDTFPSWLYQVKLGATTMWERWDGWTPEKGFQDPGMNSFNHYAFGSVGEWMYRTMCGIDSDGPGYKKITLRPTPPPDGSVTFAKSRYTSPHGEITSEWRLDGDRLTTKFIIPPNVTATAYIPTKDATAITESNKPIRQSEGAKFLWTEGGFAGFRLESGTYEFSSAVNSPRQ